LYVVGSESASASVVLKLPAEWRAASSMPQSNGEFRAPSIFSLMESPIMVGRMREWAFDVARTKHRLLYLPGAHPVQFDSTAFISAVERLVAQNIQLFGSAPYREYTFMVADDAYGGLEHPASVTLGGPSSELAKDPYALMPEFAHEFFHTWNLMRIKPAEYRGVDYRVQPPVPSLWFSEGYSLFYADLLLRRAGLRTSPTRLEHLQMLLARYHQDPAYGRYSPETISRSEYNSQPGALGNSDPSTHLIGEVIAAAIDLKLRAASAGRRSSDDVMRAMNSDFGERGFTGRDVERTASRVCGCDMSEFFAKHVRDAQRIDFVQLLRPFGIDMDTATVPSITSSGEVERDFRIRAYQPTPQDTLRIMLWNEASNWARGGLQTNDRVVSVSGQPVKTWPEFRTRIAAAKLGEPVRFELIREGRPIGGLQCDESDAARECEFDAGTISVARGVACR
jgi:predicted metalloprotease with PDZ domain